MMKKTGNEIRLYKKHITKAHIIQSAMAGLYICFAFWVMHSLHSEMAIASLGASAFIVFSFPNAQSCRVRYLLGGYCIGIVCGFLCFGFIILFNNSLPLPVHILACALAVFLAMLLMTVLNFEHPPSAALAIAITMSSNPFILGFSGLGCILALCILKKLLKKYLHDL